MSDCEDFIRKFMVETDFLDRESLEEKVATAAKEYKRLKAQNKKIASVARGDAESEISEGAPDYGNINPELEALHLEMAHSASAKLAKELDGLVAPEPGFAVGEELQGEPLTKARIEFPRVPDSVFAMHQQLLAAIPDLTGVDPAALAALQKKRSSGMETAEKIAASVQDSDGVLDSLHAEMDYRALLIATGGVFAPGEKFDNGDDFVKMGDADRKKEIAAALERKETPFLYGRPGVLPQGHIAPGQSVTIPKHAPKPKEEK